MFRRFTGAGTQLFTGTSIPERPGEVSSQVLHLTERVRDAVILPCLEQCCCPVLGPCWLPDPGVLLQQSDKLVSQNEMVLLNLLLMLVQLLLEMEPFPRIIIQVSDNNWPNAEIEEKTSFFSFSWCRVGYQCLYNVPSWIKCCSPVDRPDINLASKEEKHL